MSTPIPLVPAPGPSALALVILGLGLGVSTTSAQNAGKITVSKPVYVSAPHPGYLHDEIILASDPSDPNRLLLASHALPKDAAEMNGRVASVYLSTDGGKSWKLVLDSVSGSDPAVTFGPNHTAFYTSLKDAPQARFSKMYRSSNGGETWQAIDYNANPFAPTNTTGWDREYLVTDLNAASPHFGNVYIFGLSHIVSQTELTGAITNDIAAPALYTSRDGGSTWPNPIARPIFPPYWAFGMGSAVVLSNGTVVSIFGVWNNDVMRAPTPGAITGTVNIIASEDGGGSMSRQVQISSWQSDFARYRLGLQNHVPWLAVDPGSAAFKDRLYAVWGDARTDRYRVMGSWSSDGGNTWSEPLLIDDLPDTPSEIDSPHASVPTVAVNKDGVVVASWYQRRNVGGKVQWEVRASASLDGGEIWTPSILVADNMLPSVIPDSLAIEDHSRWYNSKGGEVVTLKVDYSYNLDEIYTGDTGGLIAAADGRFHLAWIDKRTGKPQVFSTVLAVSGAGIRNGTRELADLDDLGGKVALEIVNKAQDPKSKRVTLTVRLKNTSNDTIVGPVKLRALQASSELGALKIINAANSQAGPGAVWDLSSLLPSGGLLPGMVSTSRDLVFELAQLGPLVTNERTRYGIVNLKVRVLGRRRS